MLLNYCKKIYESFAYSDCARIGLKYKSEASVLAIRLGRLDIVPDILNQLSGWPSIDSVHLKYILLSNLNSKDQTQAIKSMLDICCLNYFQAQTLESMWNEILHLSQTCSAYSNLFKIKANLPKKIRATQGDFLNLKVCIYSWLHVKVRFHRVVVRFMHEENFIELESEHVFIVPGSNEIELSGFIWTSGRLKIESFNGFINKLSCKFDTSSSVLIAEESIKTVAVYAKMPSLLIVGQLQPFTIEVSTQNLEIEESDIELQDSGVISN